MANTATLSKDPILFLGAFSEIGTPLTENLVLAGYQVIAGTTSNEKLLAVQGRIFAAGGVRPKGFVADLTNADQVREAYCALDLERDTPLNLFLFPSRGLEKIQGFIGRELARVTSSKLDQSKRKTLQEATKSIRELVQKDETQAYNMELTTAMRDIVQLLRRNGHLGNDSTVVTLSSSGSDYDPDNPSTYHGPGIYLPIAFAKVSLVMALRREAQEDGFRFLDYVAPVVEGTQIAKFFQNICDKVAEVYPEARVNFPTISQEDLVEAVSYDLLEVSGKPRIGTRYVLGAAEISPTRPSSWDIEFPFF